MAKPRAPKKNANGNVNGADALVPPATPVETASGRASDETKSLTPAESMPETKPPVRKSTRKPELVKSDSRSNLFPINVEDEIRRLAYLLSERRGFEPGHETEDWLNAEHEVRQRYHQQQPASA